MKNKIIEKQEFYALISKRLEYAIEKMGYTQAELANLCKKNGFQISQASISKILNASSGISLINITQICQALNLNLNEVLSIDPDDTITIPKPQSNMQEHSNFIRRADAPEFQPYLGTYHIYFFPTKSSESKPIHGNLEFRPSIDSSECNVYLSFKTGKRDQNNEEILKEYLGTACISLKMNTVYCSIKSDKIGEICYFIFSYMSILHEKLECRLAAALTSSAGENRFPTVHRMLISRKKLSDKILYYLEGQLLLNSSEILISKSAYHAFLKDENLPDSFKEYFSTNNPENEFMHAASIPYYYLNESLIRDSFMDSDEDKSKAICLLRKYSVANRYNKIGGKADETVYKMLMYMLEDNIESN